MTQDETTQTMFDQPLAGESTFGRVVGRIGKKRMALLAALGIAAIGASRVPGHRLVVTDTDAPSKAVVTSTPVRGSNNLLGDSYSSDLDPVVRDARVSDQHLVSGMSMGQTDANRVFDKLHSLVGAPQAKDVSDQTGSATNAAANPVPEPASVALLAGAIAPTLIRRRRTGISA